MKIKHFFADNEAKAKEQIIAELGKDAMIMSTRKVRRPGIKGLFQKPQVEVTAVAEEVSPAVSHAPARTAFAPGAYAGGAWAPPPTPEQDVMRFKPQEPVRASFGQLATQVADPLSDIFAREVRESREIREKDEKIEALETKLDSMSTTLGNLVSKIQIKADFSSSYTPEIEKFVLSLIANEVHDEFAHKLGREAMDIVKRQGANPEEVCEQLLRQYLGEANPVKLKRFKRQVVLFIGPTGVGKTTTLAKLAAIYSVNHQANVGIITTDTYRIAAVEQLRTYADIMELPISVAYSPEEVADCLREHEDKEVVFIDTAGKSPNDKTHESEVTRLIKASGADEIHLVLSATTSFQGCLNVLGAYSFLRDFKLLFTKMDETDTWGTVLNLRFLTDKQFSYFASGQNVPDDIEVADSRKLIGRLMGGERS